MNTHRSFSVWTPRGLLSVCLLMAAGLLLGPVAAQAAPFAYITNQGDNTVSVVDTASRRQRRRRPGRRPRHRRVQRRQRHRHRRQLRGYGQRAVTSSNTLTGGRRSGCLLYAARGDS